MAFQSPEVLIRAEGLVKEYQVFSSDWERLKYLLWGGGRFRTFRALGPLDLEIRTGEAWGVVGDNGAGKTTFLKLVAGVTRPSAGCLQVRGRVASILELGTGFHPELTGRENVYLNASLYGLSREEIEARMPEIESFAELGPYFDLPVKFYSSGMYMRLSFSLVVNLDADILVIDEALAVGDGIFAAKCIEKMMEKKQSVGAVLFCSHSLYQVVSFCDRALWLEKGRARQIGPAREVVEAYEEYLSRRRAEEPSAPTPEERPRARLKALGLSKTSLGPQEDLEVSFEIEAPPEMRFAVGFAIDRSDHLCCFAEGSHQRGRLFPPGRYRLRLKSLPFLGGRYKVVLFLLEANGLAPLDTKETGYFTIRFPEKTWGVCPVEWEIDAL